METLIWIIASALCSFNLVIAFIENGRVSLSDLSNHQLSTTFSIVVIIFPVLYTLIYGRLPIQKWRMSNLNSNESNNDSENKKDPILYLEGLVNSSNELAMIIYKRASLYLLVGVLIAICGVTFFTLQASDSYLNFSGGNYFLLYVSKLGVLIFIELVAFFFLKQYRITMDDFRYYEGLKRSREETFAIIQIMLEKNPDVHVFDLVEKCGFRSSPDKLNIGQTLDHIESRKYTKYEFDLIIDLIEKINKNR
ncbi:hypothetical protein EYY95_21705 [Hafnia alvei]|uniref:hypothetical protein n=1 Tax=Hafnia alvei TaxID=569 RepID=UPI0010342AE7|nr:hypothetical protein [Hafnia alvei]TBL82177.1 hypothetical protein EYY95_21705 [Hafnia alvei]